MVTIRAELENQTIPMALQLRFFFFLTTAVYFGTSEHHMGKRAVLNCMCYKINMGKISPKLDFSLT